MALPTHQFSYEEFHAFVMLYAANADGNISEKEELCALSGLQEEQCKVVKGVFSSCDDNQALEVIFSYQTQYLATTEDRQRVLNDIATVFATHEQHQPIEQVVKHMFERLLNS